MVYTINEKRNKKDYAQSAETKRILNWNFLTIMKYLLKRPPF